MLWKKPSGLEIETVENKETIAYCKSLGWIDITPEPEIAAEQEKETPFADNPAIPETRPRRGAKK